MSTSRTFAMFLCFVGLFLGSAWAQDAQRRQRNLEQSLMAPCCWTATVAEHSSPESMKVKEDIAMFLDQGKSDDEILAHFSGEFGERILASPKKAGFNWFVWIFPAIFLITATGGISLFLRRNTLRKKAPSVDSTTTPKIPAPVSDADRSRLLDELEREIVKN